MTALRSAIDALRRALGPAQAAHTCSCGPETAQTTRIVLRDELAIDCPACGRALGRDGRGIGSRAYTLTIRTDDARPPAHQ